MVGVNSANPDRTRIVRSLFLQGKTVSEVKTLQPAIDESYLRRQYSWLKSPPGMDWVARYHPESVEIMKKLPEPDWPPNQYKHRNAAPTPGAAIVAPGIPVGETTVDNQGVEVQEFVPSAAEEEEQNESDESEDEQGELDEQGLQPGQPIGITVTPAPPAPIAPQVAPRTMRRRMVMVREDGAGAPRVVTREPPGAAQASVVIVPPAQAPPNSLTGAMTMSSPPVSARGRGTMSVTPLTLLWYDYMVAEGYKETLSQFVEDCVIGYFASKGRKWVMVMESEPVSEVIPMMPRR